MLFIGVDDAITRALKMHFQGRVGCYSNSTPFVGAGYLLGPKNGTSLNPYFSSGTDMDIVVYMYLYR